MFKHMVIYVGRSSVFTDRHFTEKLHNTLRTHEEHGWELVSTAARSGPLGDVSGLWLFFRHPAEIEGAEGADEPQKLPNPLEVGPAEPIERVA